MTFLNRLVNAGNRSRSLSLVLLAGQAEAAVVVLGGAAERISLTSPLTGSSNCERPRHESITHSARTEPTVSHLLHLLRPASSFCVLSP